MLVFGLKVPSGEMLGLFFVNGLLTALSMYFLFTAVGKDDVYRVAVLLNLSPVFTGILSFLFLGESLGMNSLLGFVFLILAGFLASITRSAIGGWRFSPALIYGVAASFTMAISNVIFKFATFSYDPISVLVWGRIFLILSVLFILVKKEWRNEFVQVISSIPAKVFALITVNELLALFGTIAFVYAVALESVTLVSAMNAVYPVFAFVFGAMYTRFMPNFVSEDLSIHSISLKLFALVFLVIGVLLIS